MMTSPTSAQTRQAWDAIAGGYDDHVTPTHLWLARRALSLVGLQKGMRFLDIACGSGALSLPAAQLGAEVTAVDLSPVMIDRLAARTRREGLTNLQAKVMDGHQLEIGDDQFDVTGSQYGVMLFPDLPRALREMARVTRPGGHVFLSVYGPPNEVEFLRFFMAAMQSAVPGFQGLPTDPPPLPFQVADPSELRRQFDSAGLKDIRVVTITEELSFQSATQMWDWLMNSNPIPRMLTADLTEDQRAQVLERLERMLVDRSGGKGAAVLTNPVHIGIASRR